MKQQAKSHREPEVFPTAQPSIRDSDPLPAEIFGPYHSKDHKLQPGHVQKMQFDVTDSGPCYMTNEESIARKYDVDTGETRIVDITKANLIQALKQSGVKEPCGSKERLQEMAQSRGLPIKYTKKIIKGLGLPKGALQILFERGWIDPLNIHRYSAKGKAGSGGVEFSVNELMQKQSDYTTEMTLLQYHASLLGVTLERSPKCHPEIAGEGIEYA